MNEKDFLSQLEEKTLPIEYFNHKAHLWLGWIYIRDYELNDAIKRLSSNIKGFAKSLGRHQKFHKTLTVAFACLIKSRFRETETFEEFLKGNNDLLSNSMLLIKKHYSSELLESPRAQKKFVSPDQEPFPEEFERQLNTINQ